MLILIQHVSFDAFVAAFGVAERMDTFSTEAMEIIYAVVDGDDDDTELDVIEICERFRELSREQLVEQYDALDGLDALTSDGDHVDDDEFMDKLMDTMLVYGKTPHGTYVFTE